MDACLYGKLVKSHLSCCVSSMEGVCAPSMARGDCILGGDNGVASGSTRRVGTNASSSSPCPSFPPSPLPHVKTSPSCGRLRGELSASPFGGSGIFALLHHLYEGSYDLDSKVDKITGWREKDHDQISRSRAAKVSNPWNKNPQN